MSVLLFVSGAIVLDTMADLLVRGHPGNILTEFLPLFCLSYNTQLSLTLPINVFSYSLGSLLGRSRKLVWTGFSR